MIPFSRLQSLHPLAHRTCAAPLTRAQAEAQGNVTSGVFVDGQLVGEFRIWCDLETAVAYARRNGCRITEFMGRGRGNFQIRQGDSTLWTEGG